MKQMNRVWILVLILVLLSTAGCANTAVTNDPLRVQLGVPDNLEEKLTTAGGAEITVNAKITVPDVKTVDVINAKQAVFSDKYIQDFALPYVNNGKYWYYVSTGKLVEDYRIDKTTDENGAEHAHFFVEYPPLDDSLYSNIEVSWGKTKKALVEPTKLVFQEKVYGMDITAPEPLENGKAADCSTTLEEAKQKADAMVAKLSSDFELADAGQLPKQKMHNNPRWYLFRYTRTLNGIPVNNAAGAEDTEGDGNFVSGLEVITAIVSDTNVAVLEYINPYDTGKTLQKSVRLLSFEEVAAKFRTAAAMSPLAGSAELYEIRLGYMTVLQSNGAYRYTPVWDFYIRTADGDTDKAEQISFMTLDAMTGDVIDRKTCK